LIFTFILLEESESMPTRHTLPETRLLGPLQGLCLYGLLVLIAFGYGCTTESLVVETAHGPVRGVAAQAETWSWKGIPFAKPPVGSLRWKAPQDPDPWEEVREAATFGNSCTQYSALSGDIQGSENCLYLNVWRPRTEDKDLPVYFWIHGGGNSVGTAAYPDYDGANLAHRSNVVVVTTQYRLGPMGWFTHPALRTGIAGDEEDDSGNYGTLDLIKALNWVRDNIEAFGGDPNLVTITGESAGGFNVLSLLVSPPAAGLFHRAMCQSGGTRSSSVADGEAHVRDIITRLLVKDGTVADETEADIYLAGMTNVEVEAYLRSKSARQIMSCHETRFGGMLTMPYLFLDGTVMPADGFESFETGTYPNKVPTILGSNKEETKLFIFMDPALLGKFELFQVAASYGSDAWKATGVDEVARRLRNHQASVYAYHFLWGAGGDTGESVIPNPWGFLLGSFHTLEIPFFFGNDAVDVALQFLVFNEQNRPGREALTSAMMAYLAEFVRTGDPNQAGSGLPVWSPWSNEPGGPKSILFDVDDTQAIDIAMSTVELTEAGVKASMAAEVPEPLYTEARDYLGW